MATKKVNIDIVARDKSKQALNNIRGNLDGLKKSVFNLRNAFIGLGAGLAIKNLVNVGVQVESLQVRLKFLGPLLILLLILVLYLLFLE